MSDDPRIDDLMPQRISDDQRREQLGGEAGRQFSPLSWLLFAMMLLQTLVMLLPGVIARLLTWPWQGRWAERRRQTAEQQRQQRREHALATVAKTTDLSSRTPVDMKLLHERAAALVDLEAYGQAELDADTVVQHLQQSSATEPPLVDALYTRAAARNGLRCRALADADVKRARRAEPRGRLRRAVWIITAPLLGFVGAFRLISGWG